MTNTLLIVGDPELTPRHGGSWRSEAWAYDIVKAAVRGVEIVVVGSRQGPEDWAQVRAERWVHVWLLGGDVDRIARSPSQSLPTTRWTPLRFESLFAGELKLRRRVKARDRAMVDGQPADARVLALVAPWSRTGGAAYTARHARERGLVVEVVQCPAEYGAERQVG